MEKEIRTLEGLQNEAAFFLSTLSPREDGATLLTLSGELGAGKTAFTQAIARVLGVTETVTSPTFVLEKVYLLSDSEFARLIHIDAYRLESGAELAPLGFAALMQDSKNLIVLEWPEKVADTLPQPTVKITISARDDGSRLMIYG